MLKLYETREVFQNVAPKKFIKTPNMLDTLLDRLMLPVMGFMSESDSIDHHTT